LRALSSHQPLSASTNRKPLPVVAQRSILNYSFCLLLRL